MPTPMPANETDAPSQAKPLIHCVQCKSPIHSEATATMLVEGMQCLDCCKAIQARERDDIAKPAGPMPGTLIAVIVLLSLNIAANLISFNLLSLLLNVALLVGIILGNDGVRKFVIVMSWIGLIVSILLFIFAVVWLPSELAFLSMFILVFGVGNSGFTVWALGSPRVREWMFKTAFKKGLR